MKRSFENEISSWQACRDQRGIITRPLGPAFLIDGQFQKPRYHQNNIHPNNRGLVAGPSVYLLSGSPLFRVPSYTAPVSQYGLRALNRRPVDPIRGTEAETHRSSLHTPRKKEDSNHLSE